MTVTVISPRSRGLKTELLEMYAYRDMFLALALREISIRYKQSVFGVAWVVLQPVVTSLIFTLVFGFFARIPSEGVPYPIFVFSGLLIWQYLSRVITDGTSSLIANANLITKVYFPRLLIPLTPAVVAGVDFLIAFVVLLVMMVILGVPPSWAIVFVPVVLAMAALLAYAVGLCLAPLNAIYRDVGYALPFGIQVVMYLSAIVYPASIVPEKYRWLFDLNPVATIVRAMRWSVLGTEPPNLLAIASYVAAVALVLPLGLRVFREMEATMVDQV
jgi:lipopolysaccharide transport system permease protein